MTAVRETKKDDGYFDKDLDAYIISVMAGFYHWSRDPKVAFSTMLGSCVSVCISDQHTGIGGMNHFLLPEAPAQEQGQFSSAQRYGSAAIESLLNSLLSNGACKNDLTIKIFGGGQVINGLSQDIGKRNVDFAKKFFSRESLRITSEDTGGKAGRRIIFFPKTGRVLLRNLKGQEDAEKIASREQKVFDKLSHQKVENDVELF